MARVSAEFAALILASAIFAPSIAAQERIDPRLEAIDALIEEFYDPLSTELETAEAGERLGAFGPLAIERLAVAAIADLRARHGWRGLRRIESLRAEAAPAVPVLLQAVGDDDRTVRCRALMTLGTLGPYLPGFDPGAVPRPARRMVRVGAVEVDAETEAWQRIATRCAVDRDAAVEDLVALFEQEVLDVTEVEMVLEILAERGPAARQALPALRELRQNASQGYHLVGRQGQGISMGLIGQVDGAVARVAPTDLASLPDYERALASNYVPERDRLAVVRRLPALGADAVPLLRTVVRGSGSRVVRLDAIRTLGRLGSAAGDALPDLDDIAGSSREARLRAAAADAAERIRGS